MDEYGCFRPQGIREIAEQLEDEEIITFSYSADNHTAFVLTIAGPLRPSGTISFGGSVLFHYLVAIRFRGSDYFDLRRQTELHPNYLAEKLGLTNQSDAQAIADLLNGIKDQFRNLKEPTTP